MYWKDKPVAFFMTRAFGGFRLFGNVISSAVLGLACTLTPAAFITFITRWVGVIGVSWPELSVRTGKSTGNRSVGDLTDKVNRQGSRKAVYGLPIGFGEGL